MFFMYIGMIEGLSFLLLLLSSIHISTAAYPPTDIVVIIDTEPHSSRVAVSIMEEMYIKASKAQSTPRFATLSPSSDTDKLAATPISYTDDIPSLGMLSALHGEEECSTDRHSNLLKTLLAVATQHDANHYLQVVIFATQVQEEGLSSMQDQRELLRLKQLLSDTLYERGLSFVHFLVVIPASPLPTTEHFYGSPRFDRAFSDGSSFSPKLTTKAIQAADSKFQASLQSFLLSAGCVTRVLTITDASSSSTRKYTFEFPFPRPSSASLRVVGDSNSAIKEDVSVGRNYTLDNLVKGSVEVLNWTPDIPFAVIASQRNSPTIFRNSVATTFPALHKWQDFDYLANVVDDIGEVKNGKSNKFYEPDLTNSKLVNNTNMKFKEPYNRTHMEAEIFFRKIKAGENLVDNERSFYGAFFDFNEMLRDDIPTDFLFLTAKDKERAKQFLWISNGGFNTYTHVDHDHNIFVQIVGYKRFTLFLPKEVNNMYFYPRVHPLWHKSQCDFHSPDLTTFPKYANAEAYTAVLGPGDILYIPPYTWHHVESLSTSISLTTWSHTEAVYEDMDAAYGVDLFFEKHISNSRGKLFACRLFIDLFIQEVHGLNQTTNVINKLLQTRYVGVSHLFPSLEAHEKICQGGKPTQAPLIPTAQFLMQTTQLDVSIVSNHFDFIVAPEVREIMILDYIEEVAIQAVGGENIFSFLYYCFIGQGYYITDEEESHIWT